MSDYNNIIVYGTIILFCILAIYYFFFKPRKDSKLIENKKELEQLENVEVPILSNKFPILTAYKSGGFAGMVYRLEVYDNGSYNVFDHDQIHATGQLDPASYRAVNYLIDRVPELDNEYCIPEGYDMIYRSLHVGEKTVSLGECVPEDIEENFEKLDQLMA